MNTEKEEPKRYGFSWFMEKAIEGIIIAIALFLLQIAGVGIMEAYLLPQRLEKEGDKMQKKFEEKIAAEKKAAVDREADLLQQLDSLRKEYTAVITEIKRFQAPLPPQSIGQPTAPNKIDWNKIEQQSKELDPEKSKLQYIQRHMNVQQRGN